MDLRYCVSHFCDSDASSFKWSNVCAVSSESVIAFSRVCTVPSDSGTKVLHCVAVGDLNSPQLSTDIVQCSTPILLLQFNSDGKQLLVVTEDGNIRLYRYCAGALQQWVVAAEAAVHGERVLAATFLHTGLKPQISLYEVKASYLYSDKFSLLPHTPSLLAPGGCATEGVIAVTSSGLAVVLAMWRSEVVEVRRSVLGGVRGHYATADIALAPDGSVVVCAWQPDVARCWRLRLQHAAVAAAEGDGDGTCESGQLLLLKVHCDESVCPHRPAPQDGHYRPDVDHIRELSPECYRVSSVRFPYRDDPTLLLLQLVERGQHRDRGKGGEVVAATHILQQYRLEERTQPKHKLFRPNDHEHGGSTYKVWVVSGEWCSDGGAVVSVGSCPRYLFLSSQLPHIITAATEDGSVTAMNLHNMIPVGTYNLHQARNADQSSADDARSRGGKTTRDALQVSLAHTWTGLCLVTYDSHGCLCFFSLIKPTDIAGNLWPLCVVLLMEYCVVSGQDWWELLINTPATSVTTVVDRLLDTLSLHPAPHNTALHSRMLLLRHAILKLSTSPTSRSTEALIQAVLFVALSLCRQLRPVTADTGRDKCASQMITAYLENRSSMEQLDLDKSVDQFLFGVNQPLDCQVDPRSARFLQPLVQFSAELALYLLFLRVQGHKHEALREAKTVQYLREVLFRGRLWHRHNRLVAPHVTRKTDSVDVWAALYRLLTRLLVALPGEPDAAFMDEVVLLETQVLCSSVCLALPTRGFLTYLQSSAPPTPAAGAAMHHMTPIQYQHGEQEEMPPLASSQLEGLLPPPNPRDPLFRHFIPEGAPRLQCTRCWSVRSCSHDPDNPWEQQWAGRCPCSGHWMPDPVLSPQN